MNDNQGFTLVEIMIVTAVIGILAAIAIPAYTEYIEKSNIYACVSEVKAYGNDVFYILHDQDDNNTPDLPHLSSCQFITDASGWTTQTQQQYIYATPKSVDHVKIQCDLNAGMSCKVMQN